MKKVAVIVRDPEDLIMLKNQLMDFEYDEKKPDFVVSFGGDGTYLVSERLYPEVPKLIVRKGKSVCAKCAVGDIYHLVSKILRKQYRIKKNCKLEATLNKTTLIAANDIVVRNKFPTHALRFKLHIDSKASEMLIGDGVVIATPIGSTGYYHSISRNNFQAGIGIAYNNTTKPIKHKVIPESSTIQVEIIRGLAVVAADNNPELIDALDGQTINIKKIQASSENSSNSTLIWKTSSLSDTQIPTDVLQLYASINS